MKFNKTEYYKMYKTLRGIYDSETADIKITGKFRTTFPVSEVIKDIEKSFYEEKEVFLRELNENWHKVAGNFFGKISCPTSIENKILYIKMKHTVYMSSISGHAKQKLLKKIQMLYGKNVCSDIRFVPPG